MKKEKGITLIALVITIIVLLILAGVAIATLTGENGILSKAETAKDETTSKAEEEQIKIAYSGVIAQRLGTGGVFVNDLNEEFKQNSTNATAQGLEKGNIKVIFNDTLNQYIIDKNGKIKKLDGQGEVQPNIIKYVNPPKLVAGMKKIMFTDPTNEEKGKTIKDGDNDFDNENWYDYYEKKWANVETEDGSMWVWIPRFAYKVNKTTQTTDIKFLIGTTDEYYEESGNKQTAKRVKTKTEVADTENYYYVHPAFTNESSIDFINGGWDKELSGIWVAKFEAAYPNGNNDVMVKASSQNYTQTTTWIKAVERGQATDDIEDVRNWLDGIYGSNTTSIKYPIFQGISYGMNNINHNDSFNIAKSLTESGNIYGLTTEVDSHLMKDSEWGAIAYIGQSQYGLNGTNIAINNISLNSGNRKRTIITGKSGVDSVYAVTGVTTGEKDGGEKQVTEDTITKVKGATGNIPVDGVYAWNQLKGQEASSTGTIYGIYDLSGGSWERTVGYVANGNVNLKTYGVNLSYNGENLKTVSTKYIMVYPHDSSKDNTGIANDDMGLNTASQANYAKNTTIHGDAHRETSKAGTDSTSWYGDYSFFPGLYTPFSIRGGDLWSSSNAGLFCFHRNGGGGHCNIGFRPVLIAK